MATKQLIDDLRLKHDFDTTDQVLRYYLLRCVIEDNNSTKETIRSMSSEVMKMINNDKQRQSKPRPVHKQTASSWQRQRKF